MSVILATQEAEIRRMVAQSQPGKIVRLYLKKPFTREGMGAGGRNDPSLVCTYE
jgi:hypothetical protein